MATFIENLRATSKLPTRGDIQKENRNRLKETILTPGRLQELLQMDAAISAHRQQRQREAADNGAMYVQNLEENTGVTPSIMVTDKDVAPFLDIQVAENADRLNKVLDDYDKAPTWKEKINVVQSAYDSFPNPRVGMKNWFNNLEKITYNSMSSPDPQYPVSTPKEISNAVRAITNTVRDSFFKKV